MIYFRFILTTVVISFTSAGTFKDDLGTEFTFTGKPKIVAPAGIALTLRDFGMDENQIVATYGSWVVQGSDLDFDRLSEGSTLPADPSPEELAWLSTKVTNLSPTCLNNERCKKMDLDLLQQADPEYVILSGYKQSPSELRLKLVDSISELGYKTIYIEISQDAGNGDGTVCTDDVVNGCIGKSMIEVIEQWEALANALGTEIPESVQNDKSDMCEAAKKFTAASKEAHQRGVRVMAEYLDETYFYMVNPTGDVVLRMFEELGMPIMHPGGLCTNKTTCTQTSFWEKLPSEQYFIDCDPADLSSSCVGKTLYPVDMVLYDHRLTVTFQNKTLVKQFGDPALVQGQIAYWPFGGRPHTYKHAAEILNIITPELEISQAIHPKSSCTEDVDVSSAEHRKTPLLEGKFACFNSSYHNGGYTCASIVPSPTVAAPSTIAPATSPPITTTVPTAGRTTISPQSGTSHINTVALWMFPPLIALFI